MAGGLLNILSESANNVFLMGSPQSTFFKTSYKKHTNFGMQKFRLDYDGIRDLRLTESSTFKFKVLRYAELLMDTYVVITLPDIWSPIYHPCAETNFRWSPYEFRWIRDLGASMIKEIEITCGSQLLQKYSGDYIRAMVDRDFTAEKKQAFDAMTGNVADLNNPGGISSRSNTYPSAYYTTSNVGSEPSIRGRQLYIPINTWFCMNSKMAFPLVSLQYNELYISVTFRPIQELFQIRDVFDYHNNFPLIAPDFNFQQYQFYRFLQTPPSEIISPENYDNKLGVWNADIHILANYCFLSADEARVFAADNQVYLVKDVFEHRFDNVVGTKKLKLNSTGMVSNWTWFMQRSDVNKRNEWCNRTNWPYATIPYDITPSPAYSTSLQSFVYVDSVTGNPILVGPRYDLSGSPTNIFVTGDFNSANYKNILETMGIVLDGEYRENIMTRGVFDYVEKYTRTAGCAPEGLYCYNFGLSTNPYETQPSGAINLSRFRNIELEVTTYTPNLDSVASQYNFVCDANGNFIGVQKQNWRLYEYTYNFILFEERYNLLNFVGGNCAMLYAR
jgi:Major capsid protein N-terminus/Large eukaryotic DNA virus major capsid protein